MIPGIKESLSSLLKAVTTLEYTKEELIEVYNYLDSLQSTKADKEVDSSPKQSKFKTTPKAEPKRAITKGKWSEVDLDLLLNWAQGFVREEQKSLDWICNNLGRSENAIEHKIRDLHKAGKL